MKITKRQREIINLVKSGYQIFVGPSNVMLSKGYDNIYLQEAVFWRMVNNQIFYQNPRTNYYELLDSNI